MPLRPKAVVAIVMIVAAAFGVPAAAAGTSPAAAGTSPAAAGPAAAPPPAAATAAPAPCSTGLGVGLVDVKADQRDPRASVYVVAHVKPGSTFTRRFQVCNGTGKRVVVQLYAGEATIARGGFTVVEGRTSGDVSSWTTVAPARATLAPGQRTIATATFRVPPRATAGERYGVLLAELPAVRGAGGVGVASRVGVRVYLGVGPGGAPKSDFRVDSLQASRLKDGTPVVTARVHNTGALALDMRGSLRLTEGPGGLSAGPFPATVGTTLAPGDTEPVTVILSRAVTGGPWLATLALQSGLLERRATGRITFPEEAGDVAPAVKAENLPLAKDRTFLGVVAGSLIFLLALILLVLGYLSSRRKAREKDPEAAA